MAHPMMVLRYCRRLHVQVLIAVVLGCWAGAEFPRFGAALNPVAIGFVNLIKMLISPIVFCAVAAGIGSVTDLKKVGRVGIKALVYFEAVTTFALVIGLVVVNWVRPGAGFNANVHRIDASAIAPYTAAAHHLGLVDYVLNIIPSTLPGALTSGEILQVLLVAILVGIALTQLGDAGRIATDLLEVVFKIMMKIVDLVVRLAPLASFAAMAFVIAKFGLKSIEHLASLMLCILITMAVFIVVVLGTVLRASGLGLWRFLRYLREEIVLVLGTSSSETALPGLMDKLEKLGCPRPVVGLVVPAGYSFNLDGTSIYLTMAAVFIAQATNTPLTLGQECLMLLVLMLASKGAAAVAGGGFITLAATLSSTPVPVAGLTLILGIDRFMSIARALVNLIGNGVAVVVVTAWEGELDRAKARRILAGPELAPLQPAVGGSRN